MRNVHEAPGEVTRVGGAKRGVGKALAGSVRRDEVLQHGQAFHEARLDRPLDDLALRVGHQPAHAGELTDLRERAACPRVRHHVNRVQLGEVRLHGVGDLVACFLPLVDDLLVPLLQRDQALVVLVVDLRDLALVPLENLLLVGRGDDVVLRNRDAGLTRVVEAHVLERVQDQRNRRSAVPDDKLLDERSRVLLGERIVDELVLAQLVAVLERFEEASLDLLVEEDAPHRREDVVTLLTAIHGQVVQPDVLVVVGKLRLLRGSEHVRPGLDLRGIQLLELHVAAPVRQEVDPEHHVLGRRGER